MTNTVAVVDEQEIADELLIAVIAAHRHLVKAVLENGKLVREVVRVKNEIRREARCEKTRRKARR